MACFVRLTLMLLSVFPEIPDAKPFIDGIVTRYRPGDELKGNCTSQFSKPAANLTWTVNDVPVCIHSHLQCSFSIDKTDANRWRLIFHQLFNSINNRSIDRRMKGPDLKNLQPLWIVYPSHLIAPPPSNIDPSNAVSVFATQTSSFAHSEINDDFIYVAIWVEAKMIIRK